MKKFPDIKSRSEQLVLRTNLAPSKPVIAVCGLLNAGKSYLLNMLTQHFDEEYFKTADQRETTVNKKLETAQYRGRFVFAAICPGLDSSTGVGVAIGDR